MTNDIHWVDLDIDRRSDGVRVTIKADKRVEDFMASLGYGASEDVVAYGRAWIPVDGHPLRVYQFKGSPFDSRFHDYYSLNGVGASLESEGLVNLAPMRLVGISKPEGVSFKITLPMGSEKVKQVKTQLLEGIRQIVEGFVVPVKVRIEIISRIERGDLLGGI